MEELKDKFDGTLEELYDRQLKLAIQAIDEDKWFRAHQIFTELFAELEDRQNKEAEAGIDVTNATELISKLRNEEKYLICENRINDCKGLLREIEEDDGWTLSREHNGIKTMYREEEHLRTHSFKVSGEVRASLFDVMAIIYELDLYKDWFPFLNKSVELATVSRFRKYGHVEADIPFPIANREVVVDGYGIDNLDENYVLIFVRSLKEEDMDTHSGATFPPQPSSWTAVRATIHNGGFLLKCASRNVTEVHFMFNIDPQLSMVPYWLVNLVTGKFVYVLLEAIRATSRFSDDSIYCERIRNNPSVYGFIKDMIEQYWSKKEKEEIERLTNPVGIVKTVEH